jgi:hypothetical protein
MKYLRLFENFNQTQIDYLCKKYKIKKYKINSDGSIDVDGDVNLSAKYLTKLPLKFNKVIGNFTCNHNKLTTLEGCPNYITLDFHCINNKLTSLEGCPDYIGRDFIFPGNNVTIIKDYPKEVVGSPYYSDNPIEPILKLFDGNVKIYLDYEETYNFIRTDSKIVKHLLIEALKDYNEYYGVKKELPKEIKGYTYI